MAAAFCLTICPKHSAPPFCDYIYSAEGSIVPPYNLAKYFTEDFISIILLSHLTTLIVKPYYI